MGPESFPQAGAMEQPEAEEASEKQESSGPESRESQKSVKARIFEDALATIKRNREASKGSPFGFTIDQESCREAIRRSAYELVRSEELPFAEYDRMRDDGTFDRLGMELNLQRF